MIELNEKAGIYAEENVVNVLKEAFAKVYADGYRDGYKDREDEIPANLRDNQTEYVDLGLPSGTLWSADYELNGEETTYLPYAEAENYIIPTKEQFNELRELCQWEYQYINKTSRKYICVGPNGNHIAFYSRGYELAETYRENEKIFFWLKSEIDCSSKKAVNLYYFNGIQKQMREMFSGKKLPLRLVKNIR